MSVQAFFDRAIREAKRYGDDPWILLRELVQNSRDAGATHIYCHLAVKDGWTILDFQDNGEGMDARQVDRYLLRLYASSKEQDPSAIGFYGVGFWSTLLFEPTTIRVMTRRTQETVALTISCKSLEIARFDGTLKHPGTRITLERPSLPGDETLATKLRERLEYYVGPIRPADGRPSLEIHFNGQPIHAPFHEPPHFPQKIRDRDFDGVIGLGPKPFVRLYKGGILVRDLTSLEEVLPNRTSQSPPSGMGLYPQISLNADHLNVLMDRQSVFEDPILHRMVETCEQRLLRIQRDMVHQLFPLNWPNRFALWFTRIPRQRWGWLVTLTLLVILGLSLGNQIPFSMGPSTNRVAANSPARGFTDTALGAWQGPTIDPPATTPTQWQFSYEGGPDNLLFRLQALTRFDRRQGWLPGKLEAKSLYPSIEYPVGETPILVNLATQTVAKPLALPVPPKYRLLPQSLLTASGKKPRVMESTMGEPLVVLAEPEWLSYQVVPHAEPPPNAIPIAMTRDQYPPEVAAFLDSALQLPEKKRAQAIANYLADLLVYSQSSQTLRLFESAKGDFIRRVLAAGGGDCDLLNGVYVLMLQSAEIPAFLSVGLVGREGKAESTMHAWVHYWAESEWVTADLIAPHHLHPLRPNQIVPQSAPVNLDQTIPLDPIASAPDALPSTGIAGTSNPGLQEVPAPPSTHGTSPSTGTWRWLGLLLFLPLILALRWWHLRARAIPPKLDRPHYLAKLFESYFRHGSGKDPLQLQFRPLFQSLQGRYFSLHQMRLLMRNQPLIAAKPNCPLLVQLPKSLPVFNRNQPIFQKLIPYLPPLVILEDWEILLNPNPLPDAWSLLEEKLRQQDPAFRLHLVADSRGCREVFLPFTDPTRGKRFFTLGLDHPLYQEIDHFLALRSAEGDFHALRLVLEKSLFFMGCQQQILVEAVRNLPAA